MKVLGRIIRDEFVVRVIISFVTLFFIYPVLGYVSDDKKINLFQGFISVLFLLFLLLHLGMQRILSKSTFYDRHGVNLFLSRLFQWIYFLGLVVDISLAFILKKDYSICITTITTMGYILVNYPSKRIEDNKTVSITQGEKESQPHLDKYEFPREQDEIAFIRGQINPHFVFNALNTVIAISRFDDEEARDLLVTISHYLRLSFDFSKRNVWTPLLKELEFLDLYLKIEKARFEEKVSVIKNIQVKGDFLIPKMVLQPVVENALLHGTLKKRQVSCIYLDIQELDEALRITVKDEGLGMTQEQISAALSTYSERGICLGNMNLRLLHLTGKPFEISSEINVGTTVTWFVPKREVFDDEGGRC